MPRRNSRDQDLIDFVRPLSQDADLAEIAWQRVNTTLIADQVVSRMRTVVTARLEAEKGKPEVVKPLHDVAELERELAKLNQRLARWRRALQSGAAGQTAKRRLVAAGEKRASALEQAIARATKP
jgi:hypothetical protein